MSKERTWVRTIPCPRCETKGRCSVCPDGKGCTCWHPDRGTWGYGGKIGDGGEQTFFRDPPANPRPTEATKAKPKQSVTKTETLATHPVGTSGELDRVYSRLLEMCPLSPGDLAHLAEQRGLEKERVASLRLGRLPGPKEQKVLLESLEREFDRDLLLKIPGILLRRGRLSINAAGSGLLIPAGPPAGEPVSSLQIRLDDPLEGGRYRLLSGGEKGAKASPEPYVVRPEGVRPGVAVLTEGWSKALAASARFAALSIGIPGVSQWSMSLPILEEAAARDVFVAWDADHKVKPEVFKPLLSAVKKLRAEGYRVRLLLWDSAHKGIDDALLNGADLQELEGGKVYQHLREVAVGLGLTAHAKDLAESLQGPEEDDETDDDDRPTVHIRKNNLRAQKRALASELLKLDPPAFFDREGAVTTVEDHRLTRPSVGGLRSDLDELFRFVVTKRVGENERVSQVIIPPPTLLETLYCRPAHIGIPKLRDFVTSPVILRDGTLATAPGYYPEHLTYYSGHVICADVPEAPTPEQVAEAVALLHKPVQDFPFLEQDRANFFALLLALIGRDVIKGLVPPFMISANTPGTGKGLLSEVVSRMATGGQAASSTWKTDGEEMRKFITSSLLAGERLVIFDNVNDKMDSGIFAAATTARVWTDRAMGGNAIVKVENRSLFLATANNPTMSAEVSRRFVTVELSTNYENPHERRGYAIPNLLEWVDENTGKVIAALLTLWRAWFAAGKPRWRGQSLGSYEDFCETIGGVLSVAGVNGFLANRERVRKDVDTETSGWRAFVGEWHRCYQGSPVTTGQLHNLCLYENPEEEHPHRRRHRPHPLLLDVLGSGNERSQASRLGRALSAHKRRVFGCHQIQKDEEVWNGCTRYRLSLTTPISSSTKETSPLSPKVHLEEKEWLNQADSTKWTSKWTLDGSPLQDTGQKDSSGLEGPCPLDSPLEKNVTTKPSKPHLVDSRTKWTSEVPRVSENQFPSLSVPIDSVDIAADLEAEELAARRPATGART